jgi:hypothetical protein
VVSAWAPPAIDTVERDHTSLLRTILDRFAPHEQLTPRVARAPSLERLLNLPSPRRDVAPLRVPARANGEAEPVQPLGRRTGMEELVRAYRGELARQGAWLEARSLR